MDGVVRQRGMLNLRWVDYRRGQYIGHAVGVLHCHAVVFLAVCLSD